MTRRTRMALATVVGIIILGGFYLEERYDQHDRHYSMSEILTSAIVYLLLYKTLKNEERLDHIEQRLKVEPDADRKTSL